MLYRKLFYSSRISLQNFHCFLLEFFLSVHCYRACVKLNSGHVRPVSNLPYVSRLSERAAADQLIDHMTINGLHLELQLAYKKHHSTESALLKVKNDILMHRDAQKVNLLFLQRSFRYCTPRVFAGSVKFKTWFDWPGTQLVYIVPLRPYTACCS